MVEQLKPERLLRDESLDVMSGVTGLIGPLLLSGHPRALELAAVCGERLLAVQLEGGGWANAGHATPLTGFSHGAAGMAAALSRLAQASGDRRFAEAAQRAVAYERSTYVKEQGNWPDFRSTSTPSQFMLSWCHGAPGILLSRLVLQATGLADEQTSHELHAARTSTTNALGRSIAQGDQTVHLCCGVFGLSSLLRLDAQINGTPLDQTVPAAERASITRAQTGGNYNFLSVDTGSINLPGLFNGKAGVVLALMEAANEMRWLPKVLSAGLL
jgi:lantibiotic modifying enzyme